MGLVGLSSDMLTGLAIDLIAIGLLVGFGYAPLRRGKEMTFMLATINVVVFGIAFAMLHVSLGVGAAFGLFALFGILRFRTGTLDVTEMSFLFAALALAVVNASGLSGLTLSELLVINAITLIALIGGARITFAGAISYAETKVVYDRADLLAAKDSHKMMADLRERTGLDVHAASVLAIDLNANTATLRLFHHESRLQAPDVAQLEPWVPRVEEDSTANGSTEGRGGIELSGSNARSLIIVEPSHSRTSPHQD